MPLPSDVKLPELFAAKFGMKFAAMPNAPSPAAQKVIILEEWIWQTDDHCKSFGIQYGDAGFDRMTKIFHGVGLHHHRWEDEDFVRDWDEALFKWTVAVSDTIQRQLVFNSTLPYGEMRDSDRKPFCDKMWKDYGPNSPLPLLEKVNGPPLRPDTYRRQGDGALNDFERRPLLGDKPRTWPQPGAD